MTATLIIFVAQFVPIIRYMAAGLSGSALLAVLPVLFIFTLVFFGMAVILLAGPMITACVLFQKFLSMRKGVSV